MQERWHPLDEVPGISAGVEVACRVICEAGEFEHFLLFSPSNKQYLAFATIRRPSGLAVAFCVSGKTSDLTVVRALDGRSRFTGPRMYRRSMGINEPPVDEILGKAVFPDGDGYILTATQETGFGIWDDVGLWLPLLRQAAV